MKKLKYPVNPGNFPGRRHDRGDAWAFPGAGLCAPAPAGARLGAPYVGPNTPWVYNTGDWFLNGILYYFFGPRYGWAPYYAYPETYVVRPGQWYGPKWQGWYRAPSGP